MVGCGVEACRLIRSPLVAHTGWAGVVAPIFDGLFVVAQDVDNRGMLHEDGLEGRRRTRNMMSKSLSVPRTKKPTKFFFQIWVQNPRSSKSTNSWSGLAFPPADRCVDCLECQGPKGFLDVLGQATKGIAHCQSPFSGAEEPSGFKSGQGVGT